MTASEIVRAVPITTVWVWLGGDEPRHGRARALYRDGDNPNAVSLDDSKCCWYDHRDQVGGGILKLICRVRQCSKQSALLWLAAQQGVELDDKPMTPSERQVYARTESRVHAVRYRLANFAHGLHVVATRQVWLADALEIDPEAISEWHRQAYVLRQATPSDIAGLWHALPEERSGVEELGRSDFENAQAITHAIVELLAEAQERRSAA